MRLYIFYLTGIVFIIKFKKVKSIEVCEEDIEYDGMVLVALMVIGINWEWYMEYG